MSLRTRTLVFSTFFGSCIAIGLLLVSLTTNYWVMAYPKRIKSDDSRGEVNFGLFYGNMDLNIGIGSRPSTVNVSNFIENEPDVMNYWLWLITALGTGLGLLSCTIAAIASVLKAASAAKKSGTMALLLAANVSSALSQTTAFFCWLIQFYQYLIHNVLTVHDRKSNWYSQGLASLGYSFYLLIISTLVVLVNIIILLYAKRTENRDKQRLEVPSEGKNQSAIMLY